MRPRQSGKASRRLCYEYEMADPRTVQVGGHARFVWYLLGLHEPRGPGNMLTFDKMNEGMSEA